MKSIKLPTEIEKAEYDFAKKARDFDKHLKKMASAEKEQKEKEDEKH